MTTKTFLQSRRDIVRLVERMGGSDTFAARPIHGFGHGRDLEATRKLTVAASVLLQVMYSTSASRRS